LLLEANLIKRFRPRFNVLMRDDKSFPYILIAAITMPQILKHRGARNRKGDYFGPFASAGAVNRTINDAAARFLLRTCSDSDYESRTRPCLLSRSSAARGPARAKSAKEDYKLVDEAVRFLRGESQNVRQKYQQLMEEAAEKLEFEQRCKIPQPPLGAGPRHLGSVHQRRGSVEEADVFAAHQEGGQTCIQVFFFRTGQNWGNRAYFPKADRS
jgi:excinuclease ABC subunit C